MGLKPLFSNANNWEPLYEVSKVANIVNSDPPSYDPIPPFFCPLQFDTPTLAIYVNTSNPKMTWKSGGLVSGNVVTGIMTGGDATSEIHKEWLSLGKVNIIRFPSLAESYSVKFYPPYWFKTYLIEIFQYIGPGLADMEAKLDAVYNTVNS